MNVRTNSGKTKKPDTAGLLFKSFGWGLFTNLLIQLIFHKNQSPSQFYQMDCQVYHEEH